MGAGTGTLGDSVVDFEYDVSKINLGYQYGVTDKLTIGVNIPYWWSKNTVSANLDTASATIGKSAIGVGFAAPLVSIAVNPFGDVAVLTTDDIQDLLGAGLDIDGGGIDIPGFGYERVETWSGNGIGDIDVGMRYQYKKTDDWRLAVTSGVSIPTGETNDPDNLLDYPLGGGPWGLFLHLNNDYTAIEDLVLNGTFRYMLQLPDKETLRVPMDPDLPITRDKEEVDRDLGDIVELEGSASYSLSKLVRLQALYKYAVKMKNEISGDMGFAYDQGLERNSDTTQHVFVTGISYSTVPLYLEKKFPVPFSASIKYRNRFAGENVFKSQYISMAISSYF
jgi:hypothetical protein